MEEVIAPFICRVNPHLGRELFAKFERMISTYISSGRRSGQSTNGYLQLAGTGAK
jgi:hypothetical protein